MQWICEIGIDRFIFIASRKAETIPPDIPGFCVVRDFLPRSQTTTRTYIRVRELVNPDTHTRLWVAYRPRLRGLAPFKVSVGRPDRRRFSRDELGQIVSPFTDYRLLLVEVASDFLPESCVDAKFIQRFAIFGKSRPCPSRFPNTLRYGGRRTGKLIRCYWKKPINRFRVEVELHSLLLRRWRITQIKDLQKLPSVLCPKHFKFVTFNEKAVLQHLARREVSRRSQNALMHQSSQSIHAALEFLRCRLGVKNPHRFLRLHPLNEQLASAVYNWARTYGRFS
jgi:hypothetical protein